MIVVDTNVLIYATLEDSEFHTQSLEIIEGSDIIVPQIVVFEYIKVLSEIVQNLDFIKTKISELNNFVVVCEDLNTIALALRLLAELKLSLKDINDMIILTAAIKTNSSIATFDQKLRKIADKKGVKVLP
ncbi:PIN domain-containing protein [Saccharolobus solfataricus]|nr:PIN domain-containing protein [Saccharolobus solfataricus]